MTVLRRGWIAQVDPTLPAVRVWETEGGLFACVAATHGPFCKACFEVDLLDSRALLMVADGDLLISWTETTGVQWKVTEQGQRRVALERAIGEL